MPTSNRRKRHRILALIAAGAVAMVVALVLVLYAIGHFKTESTQADYGPDQPGAQPPTGPGIKPPLPEFQDASCPDVMTVSVPGTWESSPQLDPANPTQFPNALLLNVTRPLVDNFGGERLQVYTVPYTAQFHNPFSRDGQISYDDSRREGTEATRRAMAEMTARCPLTRYVIVGFSQGAVIAGDVASDIGNDRGVVDERLVLGVMLIADGRRQTGVGQHVEPSPPGQGAEITLYEVPFIPPGMTMTGPRDGGFGLLNDRTFQICALGDLICAAPEEAFNITNLGRTLDILTGGAGDPIHAVYASPQFWKSPDGLSSTEWARGWAIDTVENAPRPPHR